PICWNFGDGTTSTEEIPTHQYLSTGSYTVRLDVSNGTCTNFTEQEITIYPEPPTPSFTINTSIFCQETAFIFTNTTDETGLEEVISYLWDFGEGTEVTTKDASFTYSSSGAKTIRLTASIPGCETVFEQTIEVLTGPTSAFISNVVCQNEITTFTNTSENADSYHWNFGDGFESTSENPTHLYEEAGSYMTTLTSTDSNGCSSEVTNEVIVSDIPVVNFDFELACSSTSGVQFTDMTVVENADIVGWTWLVDGIAQSMQQNPILEFESSGIKTIRLVTSSSNGCTSAYEEQVDIRNTPEPDFSFVIGCLGEVSTFTDITSSVGNSITQWLWTIEGETYNTEEVSHVFIANGFFDVTLEVTAENFCTETITKTIEVLQLPSVDFSFDGICSNEVISLFDISTDFEDAILSRNWMLDGASIGNGTQVFVEELDAGTYSVELEVETEAGCLLSSFQDLIINPTPESSFTSSKTYGLPGDEITFTNTSIGGTSNEWYRNDVSFASNVDNASITFSEVGEHEISLVSTNASGCSDTTLTTILIAIPEVDLVIQNFEIVEQNGIGQLFLDIQNLSNLPVEVIDVFINLEDKLGTSEQVLELIDIGATERIALDVGIPLTFSKPSFLCVNLQSQYQEFEDINPLNNERCLTLEPKVQIEAPFPNPVRDEFRMKVVLPEGTQTTVSLMNSAGKIEQSQTFDFSEGLNNVFIDMSALSTGIYLVTIELNGKITTYRIFKL
ncbi:MAG: PKD domain-containing protein, partial [Ekhidna sp.]